MKKFFRPAALLLYFLVLVVFCCLGMLVAAWLGMARDQGLAGGAIILWYGIVSAVFGLIGALIVVSLASPKVVRQLNRILAILLLIITIYLTYRLITLSGTEPVGCKIAPKVSPVEVYVPGLS